MSLFPELDEVPRARAVKPSKRTTARKAKTAVPVLDGLEKPYEPPHPARAPIPDRIEEVAQRIDGGEVGGKFRCDAVTHTLVLMLYRQFEYSLGLPDGRLCHPGMTDDQLTEAYEDGITALRSVHGPDLFPTQPVWKPDGLRRWTTLWHGVDLIGWRGSLDCDVIALVFQSAANMTAKQKGFGTFLTPYDVTRMMAEMQMGGDERPWARSVLDPCVGPGSMLVAAWDLVRQRLVTLQRDGHLVGDEAQRMALRFASRLAGVDIDGEAAWTAAAQLAVRTGVRAEIARGNSLGDLSDLVPARHPHRSGPSAEPARLAS